jgi:carbamate kinase
MRLVVALGGNALLRRGEPLDAAVQQRNLARAGAALAAVARDHDIVVTHGNGPQIGLIALQAAAYRDVAPYPLDVLGAESEGMIGYMIEQELAPRLPGREFATLLTQVEVDPTDPAFSHPTKPIGPVYDSEAARRLAHASG